MKSFNTSIVIDATANEVWGALADVGNWTSWNTTVDKVDGKVGLGEKITVYAKASPGRAFPLKVAEYSPPERMVWKGGMPLGLFTGKRTYTVTPHSENSVEFKMHEAFTGLMAPLITKSIPDLQPSFDEFASCLKKHVENKS